MPNPFDAVLGDTIQLDSDDTGGRKRFPLMPVGEAVDMGHGPDGTPLFDPRIFDSLEFGRNPYPYYRILRDHYPVFHDKLHNAYYVTRYQDIADCYFDEIGFNTIPKGSSSGVLGNTQLELSGIEHRRRRNIYGRHLVGAALTKRLHALREIAQGLIDVYLGLWRDHEAAVLLTTALDGEFPRRVESPPGGAVEPKRMQVALLRRRPEPPKSPR